MRILKFLLTRHPRRTTPAQPQRKRKRLSRYKRSISKLQTIPAFSQYPEKAERALESLKWGKRHLKKSDRFDWLVGLWKRYFHLISDPEEDPYRARALKNFPQARIVDDLQAFDEVFLCAFPEIQEVAEARGCRPIMDMPFYERINGRLMPLAPDTIVEQLEELEERHLSEFMAQNRFCEEGEPYLVTRGGWQWFRIRPGKSKQEGRAMRHCGNVPSWVFGDHIYSLREPFQKKGKTYWKPHISIVCNGLCFRELKGFSNRKPATELHPHIVDLLGQQKFRGFARPGYCPRNDFHICDLSEADVRELFQRNPSLRQDHLEMSPEPVCTLPNGWRWVFIPNVRVNGYCSNLNQLGYEALWSLRGRRGWHVLQEPLEINGKTQWIHRMILSTRSRNILGIVRLGNVSSRDISEALYCLMKDHAPGLFYFDVFGMLSDSRLDELLTQKPGLLKHFCLDTVMKLEPPSGALNWYLSHHIGFGWRVEDAQTLVFREFSSQEAFLGFLSGQAAWSEVVGRLPDYSCHAATAFVRNLQFRPREISLESSPGSGLRLTCPLGGMVPVLRRMIESEVRETETAVLEWLLRPGFGDRVGVDSLPVLLES